MMKKNNKNASTPNKGKCVFKHLYIDCYKQSNCYGYQKKQCKVSEISNITLVEKVVQKNRYLWIVDIRRKKRPEMD